MNAPGFNPINWNCIVSGCFNYHRHYDIEHFAQCFPSKINFTDLDAFVEINGHFLLVEFKLAALDIGRGADMSTGQRRAFEALTRLSDKITIIVARCNYTTSEITEFRTIYRGKTGDWEATDLDQFTGKVQAWSHRVAPERRTA